MAVMIVSVETLGGATAWGPEEVDARLKIGSLKALVAPDKHIKLLDKATYQALEDEDSLPSAEPHLFLLVQYVAAPVKQEASLPKMGWESNLAESLSVGDTFGDDGEYTMDKLLGEGSQAQVFACTHRDGRRFAVKVFRKSLLASKSGEQIADVENTRGYINFRREVESHRSLHHRRIVKVVEEKDTDTHLFLLMELGLEDLAHRVQRGALKEPEARYVFQQLLEGIGFMHSQGILHRDLKLENIIIHSVTQNPEGWDEISIKIGDFGLSKMVGVGVSPNSPSRHCLEGLQPAIPPRMTPPPAVPVQAGGPLLVPPPPLPLIRATTAVGTNSYIAPEVLSRKRRESGLHYDKEVDYFSLGICLHVMLTGDFPFDKMNSLVCDHEIQELQKVEDSFFESEAYKSLSSSAQSLIAGLMRVDAARRFTLVDCCASDWAQAQHVDLQPPMLTLETRPSAKGARQEESGRSHVMAAGG